MSRKLRRLLVIYTAAALLALTAFAWAAERQLGQLRLAADTGSARAFEAAVTSVDALSEALRKLGFTDDAALGKRLCAEAYAEAQAAETALSILPFSTQELEKLAGFLGRAGDYAGSLCTLADERLGDEDRGRLAQLGRTAADFAENLRALQGRLHEGSVVLDSRERPIRNVNADGESRKLSELLLDYEQGFAAPETFAYEGRFSPAQPPAAGTLSEAEGRALAAKAAGVAERELREEYDCEGPDGRRCYSAGGMLLGVSSRGLDFAAQPRLVSGGSLGMEEARKRAEQFLERLGYRDLALCAEEGGENVAAFRYAPTQDGVPRPDDALRISIALDDGSVYAFDATSYRDEALTLSWDTDEQTARSQVPEGVEVLSCRRLIRKSPGGHDLACWELLCADAEGTQARVYVNAATGRPCAVEL